MTSSNAIGVDIVEIERCIKKLERNPALYADICAPGEQGPVDPAAFARRWALKEAVTKAAGFYIPPSSILIEHTKEGAPKATILDKELSHLHFEVSVSDDAGLAVAVATCSNTKERA